MRGLSIRVPAAIAVLSLVFPATGAGSAEKSSESAESSRASAESEFAEILTGSVLIGVYTVDGKDASPAPDRYEIVSATRQSETSWMFVARYGKVTLPPLILPVRWAGNTPVITLDNFTIPLLGTFDCRVMFDGRRYAGTWQHGEAGGHMWGRIEKLRNPVKAPRPQARRGRQPAQSRN